MNPKMTFSLLSLKNMFCVYLIKVSRMYMLLDTKNSVLSWNYVNHVFLKADHLTNLLKDIILLMLRRLVVSGC